MKSLFLALIEGEGGEALLAEKGEISSSVFFKMKKKSGQLNNVASSLIL